MCTVEVYLSGCLGSPDLHLRQSAVAFNDFSGSWECELTIEFFDCF